eukprot:RCo000198
MADFQQTLLDVDDCHVFKLPPRQSAAGYKAEEWEGCHIWTGKCKVLAKGEICEVRLEDANTGEPFAVCSINTNDTSTKFVEPVTDSSRYFVLRIEDGKGHHAFIGMGFQERSQAFDFSVSITDFKNQVKRQKEAKQGVELIQASNKDYSLKEGQKIRVELKGKNKVETKGPSEFAKAVGMGSSSGAAPALSAPAAPGLGLAPPPGGKKSAFRSQQPKTVSPPPPTAGPASSASTSTAPPAPAAAGKKDDLDFLFS